MWKLGITIAALLPSLWMMWQAGGMPHLGYFHDDGIYAGTAAALAEGRGLRAESLPGEPLQVKYPPLYPLFLAAGARWEWGLTLLAWAMLPALLYQVWRWRQDPWLVGLVGWNLFSVIFASTTLSEVCATVFVVLAVRLLEGDRVRAAAVSAGLGYLVRSALVALPAGAVLWLLWKRRWRDAGLFVVIFAPFFVGWSAVTAMYTPANLEGGWIYYLSYPAVFKQSMSWELLPTILSTNFQGLVEALGGLLFFNAGTSFWEKNFARLLLFASVSGLIRQGRKDGLTPYPLVAVPYMVLLVVWTFVPNERFTYPLLPLLLDGFLTEIRHFRSMLAVTWTTQRGATVVIGGMVAAGLLWAAERNFVAAWTGGPPIAAMYKERAPEREQAYAWIRANTPAEANFLAYEDPALRRHTGRHAMGIHCPSKYLYTNDTEAIYRYHDEVIRTMEKENLQYLLLGPTDLAQDIRVEEREKILRDWRTRADLETVYESPRYLIRKRRPVQSGM